MVRTAQHAEITYPAGVTDSAREFLPCPVGAHPPGEPPHRTRPTGKDGEDRADIGPRLAHEDGREARHRATPPAHRIADERLSVQPLGLAPEEVDEDRQPSEPVPVMPGAVIDQEARAQLHREDVHRRAHQVYLVE